MGWLMNVRLNVVLGYVDKDLDVLVSDSHLLPPQPMLHLGPLHSEKTHSSPLLFPSPAPFRRYPTPTQHQPRLLPAYSPLSGSVPVPVPVPHLKTTTLKPKHRSVFYPTSCQCRCPLMRLYPYL